MRNPLLCQDPTSAAPGRAHRRRKHQARQLGVDITKLPKRSVEAERSKMQKQNTPVTKRDAQIAVSVQTRGRDATGSRHRTWAFPYEPEV